VALVANGYDFMTAEARFNGPAMPKIVLFLCTGNYYRSRFAEELFNHRAAQGGLSWFAQSRALAIERGTNNVGTLSPYTVQALQERGLVAREARRPPQQCSMDDLQAAGRIVALNESEHRPLMLERFPGWENRAEYWAVRDIALIPPSIALDAIESQVDELVERLARTQEAAR
jgi:protein-tyrosine phosphatase